MDPIHAFGQQAENFIHNILRPPRRHQPQTAQPTPQQPPQTVPPASLQTRRQLPKIRATPDDLMEVCNRECCICTESIQVNDILTRLPCAHMFHPDCIQDWLVRRCMCPICRYELPTDDAMYETGRVERMKHRKPRFARHEVSKLSIGELRQFAKNRHIPRTILDRNGLIEYLISTDCIELIPGDFSPVRFRLSELRTYSIKRLRETMNEAGVFFDRKDIVEKEDMIKIFVNSGRLEVVPERATVPAPEVETVHSEDEDESTFDDDTLMDTRRNGDLVMEEVDQDDSIANVATMVAEDSANEDQARRSDPSYTPLHESSEGTQHNDVPLDEDEASSLLETIVGQVATLDTWELASLHETISRILDDRNHSQRET